MKILENITIVKETEKAVLVNVFISEIDKELDLWLPKSKIEIKEESIEMEKDFWEEKLEKLKTPIEEDSIFLYVNKYEELEKSYKLILSVSLNKINISPWAFVPKSQVIEITELTENEDWKFCFKIKKWIWDKTLENIIKNQLEFFNKDREESEKFNKRNFTLHNQLEE